MKYVPMLTIGLWLALIAGFYVAREILFNPYILFPAFVLLSILIPTCFWYLQLEKRRVLSLLFIAIFTVNCSVLLFNLVKLGIQVNSIDPSASLVINPEKAAQRFSGEKAIQRLNMSRHIYESSGLVTAYLNDHGALELFAPDDMDKSTMYLKMAEYSNKEEIKGYLVFYIQGIFLILAIHITVFIGIIVYLILREGPGSALPIRR